VALKPKDTRPICLKCGEPIDENADRIRVGPGLFLHVPCDRRLGEDDKRNKKDERRRKG